MNNNATQTVLLVDDNAAHRKLIKRAMLKSGISIGVIEAGSLQEARSLLFGETPGNLSQALVAAVIDLHLGDGRGTTLLQEIRNSKQHAQMPILVLSTSGLETDITESYNCGANKYLTKSDNISDLSKEIGLEISALLEK